MSVVFSGTLQGYFTSDGTPEIIQLPTSVDYMYVRNMTIAAAGGANTGAEFYWQRGMTQGTGIIYTKAAGTNALTISTMAAPSGFYLIDTSINVPGSPIATTGITGALPPVVTTGNTTGLRDGTIVRLYSPVGALQLGGMDFTISNIVASTSFELAYMPAIAAATPGAGTYRVIPYTPYFYPSNRYITKISQESQALVTMSVTHNYTIGQVIRFVVPTVTSTTYGMTELNGLQATIVDIDESDGTCTNTIRVDIDTTGFTPFALPLTANPYHTFAQVIPMGESTREAIYSGSDMLGDSTENQADIGMQLMSGTLSPAGVNGNLIYWVAGKSSNV